MTEPWLASWPPRYQDHGPSPRSNHGYGLSADLPDVNYGREQRSLAEIVYGFPRNGFRTVRQQEEAQRNMRRAIDFPLRFGTGHLAKAYQEAEAEGHREYVRKQLAISSQRAFWYGLPNPFVHIVGYLYPLTEETKETIHDALTFVEYYGLPLTAQDLTTLT